MVLQFLDTKLNVSKEHELFPTDKQKGFKVTVQFALNGNYNGNKHVFNNVTEVHHLFEPMVKVDDEERNKRIAFESSIHRTGCNYQLSDIESVVIELAETVEDYM